MFTSTFEPSTRQFHHKRGLETLALGLRPILRLRLQLGQLRAHPVSVDKMDFTTNAVPDSMR